MRLCLLITAKHHKVSNTEVKYLINEDMGYELKQDDFCQLPTALSCEELIQPF